MTHQTDCSEPPNEDRRLHVEVQELRARVQMLEAENQTLLKRISELIQRHAAETDKDRQLALALELEILQERINQRNRDLFGSKSEKRGRPKNDKAGDKQNNPRKRKRTGSERTKQPELPMKKVRHLLDEADKICPDCGGKLHAKTDKFDSSERIVVSERVYTLVTDEKQTYGCGGCGHSDTALAPAQLVPGGRYDSSVAVNAAVDKYVDHQPLNRQVATMRRAGLRTSRQAMWNQIDALARLCEPSYLALHDWMLREHKMLHADETTWRMMLRGGSAKWWLWALAAGDGFFCMALPTRGTKAARQLLRDYDGALMSDAYTVYKSLAKEALQGHIELNDKQPWRPMFEMFVCWSHARRRFEQASKNNDDAHAILDLIAKLYEVEARAKKLAGGDEAKLHENRKELRDSESAAIIKRIDQWRSEQLVMPGTKMADGMTFLNNQWRELTGFLANPLVPLDNNLIEREVRTPVMGRKNHLGSHSARGAFVSALFYSLFGSCRLVGVSPVRYMQTLVERGLQTKGYVLLPHDFAAELAPG